MKIAISGKGGSGKTTLSAGLIKIFTQENKSVIAIDCDPDMSLGLALGFSAYSQIKPICEMKELICQRTESGPDKPQGFFKINPKVDDIPEAFCPRTEDGLRLIVMGKVNRPQGGCLCPENSFLRSLVSHLLLQENEVVIMDMPAGSEHLGRATAKGVDIFLITVEPTELSVKTARHIQDLARSLGIGKVWFIGNKIKCPEDIEFIDSNIGDRLIGTISYNKILEAQRGKFAFDDKLRNELRAVYKKLVSDDLK